MRSRVVGWICPNQIDKDTEAKASVWKQSSKNINHKLLRFIKYSEIFYYQFLIGEIII